MFKNIANFSNTKDYLPLLNGVLITDLFVILLLNMNLFSNALLIASSTATSLIRYSKWQTITSGTPAVETDNPTVMFSYTAK